VTKYHSRDWLRVRYLVSGARPQLKFKAAVCVAMIVTLSLQHNAPPLFSDCPTFEAESIQTARARPAKISREQKLISSLGAIGTLGTTTEMHTPRYRNNCF
jgi:hypothetical protein